MGRILWNKLNTLVDINQELLIKSNVMKKFKIKYVIACFLLGVFLSSCASSKDLRKCDGRKGQKTPMGLI